MTQEYPAACCGECSFYVFGICLFTYIISKLWPGMISVSPKTYRMAIGASALTAGGYVVGQNSPVIVRV
jgi:hypothetical protein